MPYHYLDETDAGPRTIPNVHTFRMDLADFEGFEPDDGTYWGELFKEGDCPEDLVGWWVQFELPGCLPENDPSGPFDTEEAALVAYRAMYY